MVLNKKKSLRQYNESQILSDQRAAAAAEQTARGTPGVTNYSSGESPKASEFATALKDLPPSERDTRLLWFWLQAFRKALGAAMIIRKHEY
jgi:TPR repeat protein